MRGQDEQWRQKYRIEREKRLRVEGLDQYQSAAGEFAAFARDPWAPQRETRAAVETDADVVIVGGGISCLLAAARLKDSGIDDIWVIEEAGDFGGAWYWNRYPGVMCDIESYIYMPLLEELDYVPTQKYATGQEILDHLQRVAQHYDLYRSASFQTTVTALEWDSSRARWRFDTDRGDRINARFGVITVGGQSRPKLPGVPGILEFEGVSFHTSRWDYAYTGGDQFGGLHRLKDKRVAIIGTGATGIQCIPHVAESAQKLYVVQRTPAAVDVRNNRPTDPAWAASLEPGWQQRRLENFTRVVSGYDEPEDLVDDSWTAVFKDLTGVAARREAKLRGTELSADERRELLDTNDFRVMERIRTRVRDAVADPSTAEALLPWYKRWCKRPAFHDEYLPAFNRPNVTLVDTDGRGPDRITKTGVVVRDAHYDVDCLIFATGFSVGVKYTARTGYEIVGRDGARLSERWSAGMRTFQGLCSHRFPNLFFMGLTQTGVTPCYTHIVSEQATHLAYIIDQVRAAGSETVEAHADAEDQWVAEISAASRRGAAYYQECTPGYLTSEGDLDNPDGPLAGAYGPGPVKFFEYLRAWRDEGSMEGLLVSRRA